jgi:hypothetical protein
MATGRHKVDKRTLKKEKTDWGEPISWGYLPEKEPDSGMADYKGHHFWG